MIVNKPAGVLTHPVQNSDENTIQDYLKENFRIEYEFEDDRQGIVHRLDRVTSGLLVCPLNRETHLDLKSIFQKREIQKKYRAIVEGNLKTDSGTIDLPLASSNTNRKKRSVSAQGREAITEFKVLSNNDKYSWIELNLITGRNHQIRAHLEYLKTPIVNDILYGANHHESLEKNMICLQAFKLKFLLSNENFEFTIDQPDYFSSIL